jgi:hypothetical protein
VPAIGGGASSQSPSGASDQIGLKAMVDRAIAAVWIAPFGTVAKSLRLARGK